MATARLCSNGNRRDPRTPPITPFLHEGGGVGGVLNRRQDPTNFHTRHRKSRENTSVPAWRCLCRPACVVKAVAVTVSGPAVSRSAGEVVAAVDGGVVASGRFAAMENIHWSDLELLFLDLSPVNRAVPAYILLAPWSRNIWMKQNAWENQVQPRRWWARSEDPIAQRGSIPAWDQLRGKGEFPSNFEVVSAALHLYFIMSPSRLR